MTAIEDTDYEGRILRARRIYFVFCAVCIGIPILSVLGVLKPETQTVGEWFQRSGSIMVVFALFAEMKAYEMFDVLKPAALVDHTFGYVHQKYKRQIKFFNVAALFLAIVGTVIWGYGDLIVCNL